MVSQQQHHGGTGRTPPGTELHGDMSRCDRPRTPGAAKPLNTPRSLECSLGAWSHRTLVDVPAADCGRRRRHPAPSPLRGLPRQELSPPPHSPPIPQPPMLTSVQLLGMGASKVGGCPSSEFATQPSPPGAVASARSDVRMKVRAAEAMAEAASQSSGAARAFCHRLGRTSQEPAVEAAWEEGELRA